MPQVIANKILNRVRGHDSGYAFTSKDFLDLAGPDAVRQTLASLARRREIRRLARGLYDYPAHSALLGGPASPAPDAVAHAIARAHGWTILPAGETALNMLGLSTQVPARWEYFSDGPTKRFEWDGGSVVMTHRAIKETGALSPRTALVVQALKTLGQEHVDDAVLRTLRTRLSAKERKRAVREGQYVTTWVYEVLKRLAPQPGEDDA